MFSEMISQIFGHLTPNRFNIEIIDTCSNQYGLVLGVHKNYLGDYVMTHFYFILSLIICRGNTFFQIIFLMNDTFKIEIVYPIVIL
jgi:hypothetical protein